MKKLAFIFVAVFVLFFTTNNVFALPDGVGCDPDDSNFPRHGCDEGLVCRAVPAPRSDNVKGFCTQANTIQIGRPTANVDGKTKNIGYTDISNFISNIVTIAFIIAIIVVLIMLILGAYEWIVSGGDKEAVGKARNRIINALIGLAVLAVAFALANLGAQVLGFPNLTDKITLPTPQ